MSGRQSLYTADTTITDATFLKGGEDAGHHLGVLDAMRYEFCSFLFLLSCAFSCFVSMVTVALLGMLRFDSVDPREAILIGRAAGPPCESRIRGMMFTDDGGLYV